MSKADAEVEPCWDKLSRDFAAVVRIKGPVLIGDVAGAYSSVHGSTFKLHGHRLKDCLRSGQLSGVEYNLRTDRVCLVESTKMGDKASRKAHSGPNGITRRTAPTMHKAPTTTRTTKPPGISSTRNSGKPKPGWTATSGDRDVWSTLIPVTATLSGTAPPANTMEAPEEESGTPSAGPDGYEYLPSYFLVDCVEKSEEFIGTSLKAICTGHAVAVQLEGRRLGAEDGEISIIKVGRSRCPRIQYRIPI